MRNKVTVQIGTEWREFDLSEVDDRQRWLIKTTLESERAELLLMLYTEVSTPEMNEILKKIMWTNEQLDIVEESIRYVQNQILKNLRQNEVKKIYPDVSEEEIEEIEWHEIHDEENESKLRGEIF